ncbi:unnamed protein product [Symbiodinium sp. CCMP2592]|nr:unnamed protein product [Symbiodinium sp. CCMP2592]
MQEDGSDGTPSHNLEAKLELRSQLEEATSTTTAAPLSVTDPQPFSFSAGSADGATTLGNLDGSKTLSPSPRSRPPEAVQREEELKETFRRAAERSSWNPDYQSDESWNGRHHLSYCNDEMSQNCRCYFDRWLDHKELLPQDAIQVQKPTWLLEPDGVSPAQRKVERQATCIYSVTGPGLRAPVPSAPPMDSEAAALSKENVLKRRAMRVSRERPWELAPPPFFLSQRRALSRSSSDCGKVSAGTQTELFGKELPNWMKEQAWDSHHHATWSNFQNLQGAILNPAPVRSYFDRPREPDVGARSAEKKPLDPKEGAVRILPLYRLEPLPGIDHVEIPEGGLWPRFEPLECRSGVPLQKRPEILGIRHDASPEFKHKSTWSCPSLLTTSPNPELVEKQQSWNTRHQITFQNEEVSRLDRSYFDRFREHHELRAPDSPRHADCSVWSLGKDVSTKESARTILSNSEHRFRNDGKWMHRHQLAFDNNGGRMPVQRNLRCYFDRWRDFPSEANPGPEDILPEDSRRGTFTFMTESSRGKRRCKLKHSPEAGNLKVDVWSLVEKPSKQKVPRVEETFRSCNSAQDEKRRSKWLANHHVVF